jgi:hypothetical protein
MFDESGADYRPPIQPKTPPARSEPLPKPPLAEPQVQPVLGKIRRPWWVMVTVFILGMTVISRYCSLVNVGTTAAFIFQLGTAVVLSLTIVGLLGMRRWGVWLLLLFSGWSMIHAVVVGVARILVIDEEVSNLFFRDQILLSELFSIGLTVVIYGIIAVWFTLRRREFISAGINRYGNIPFVLILGVLILYTASQIGDARTHVRLQEEAVKESQDILNGLFGQ